MTRKRLKIIIPLLIIAAVIGLVAFKLKLPTNDWVPTDYGEDPKGRDVGAGSLLREEVKKLHKEDQ